MGIAFWNGTTDGTVRYGTDGMNEQDSFGWVGE